MRQQCHGGIWSEDKVRAKGYVNIKLQDGQTVKLTKILYVPEAVKTHFERIKARLEGFYNGVHSVQNDHREEQSEHDLRRKEQSKQEYDVLFEGKEICPRGTIGNHQYARKENGNKGQKRRMA